MKNPNYPPDITTTNTEGVTKNALEASQYEEIPLSEEELKARAQKASAEGAKVVQLRQEAVEGAAEQKTAEKENEGAVFQLPKKEEKVFSLFPKVRTTLTKAMAFLGLLAATQGNAQNNTKVTEKNLQAKEIQATGEQRIVSKGGGAEGERFTPTGAVSYQKGLRPYLKANTVEGGITPTGKSNSFENNKYRLTMGDLYEIGAKFRINTANNKSFQRGIYKKVMEIDPTVIDAMWEEYGETAAGEYDDGDLGGRTLYLAHFLKQKMSELQGEGEVEIVQTKPPKDSIPGTDLDTLPSIEPGVEKTFNLKGYKKLLLLVDKSPSMGPLVGDFLDYVLENNKDNEDLPVSITGYTMQADTAFDADNLEKAAAGIRAMSFENSNTVELTLDNAIDLLEQYQGFPDGQTVLSIVTDEGLQGFTREKINTINRLAQEKNVTPLFVVLRDGKIHTLSMDDVSEKFEEEYVKFSEREKRITEKEAEINHWTSLLQKRTEEMKQNYINIHTLLKKIDNASMEGKSAMNAALEKWGAEMKTLTQKTDSITQEKKSIVNEEIAKWQTAMAELAKKVDSANNNPGSVTDEKIAEWQSEMASLTEKVKEANRAASSSLNTELKKIGEMFGKIDPKEIKQIAKGQKDAADALKALLANHENLSNQIADLEEGIIKKKNAEEDLHKVSIYRF
jgi:hypothetical protein